jgi:hypothetical protein
MRIARLVLCAGVAACATAPDFIMAPPSPELGTVYVYRPANRNESGKSPDVYVGDEKLFALQNAGYAVVLLPPGEHQLVVRNLCFPAVQQKVAVRAGESTFLRFSVQDPLRPPPNESSGHWLADLFQLSDRTAELKKWSEEWCELPPLFEAVEKDAASSEIAQTKLVDGGAAEGVRLKQK